MPKKQPARRRTPNRRRNPSLSRLDNPGGAITGILMNGLWVGVGMYAGGIISGFTSPILGGLTGSLGILGGIANGLINAYITAWLAHRTIGHGELIAAGAFAGTAMSAISGVLGGAGSLVSSVTSAFTGGSQPAAANAPAQPNAPSYMSPDQAAARGLQPQPQIFPQGQATGVYQPGRGTPAPSHTFGDMEDLEDQGPQGFEMKGAAN